MKAIIANQPGSADILSVAEVSKPTPNPQEILIEVAAAGINRPDIMQRMGMYPPPPGASEILGLEVAGTVIEIGDDVEGIKIGDRVCALVTGGGYAEYCIAPAALCLPIPNGFSMVQAAGIPETYFTVWSNLFQRGSLKSGESLLIHGGTSGIGTTAIQLAKSFDATIYITAGNQKKCAFCVKLGAKEAIDYKHEDFVERIKSLTENGVDLILDIIGGDYLQRNLSCLKPDGRLVQIALQGGPKTQINLLPIMIKRLTVTGSTLRPRSVAFKADIAKELTEKVWPLLEAGSIEPVIHSTFPLADAAKAHRLMESSRQIGKIILTM